MILRNAMDLKSKTTASNTRLSLVRDRKEAKEKTPSPPFRPRSRRNRNSLSRSRQNPRPQALQNPANTRHKDRRTTCKPVLHGCENSRFCPGTSEWNEQIPESRQKRKKEKNEKLEPGFESGPNIEKLPGIPNGQPGEIRPRPEKTVRAKCRYGQVKRNPHKTVGAGPKRLTDRLSSFPAEIPHPSSTDTTHYQTICFIDRTGDGGPARKKDVREMPDEIVGIPLVSRRRNWKGNPKKRPPTGHPKQRPDS